MSSSHELAEERSHIAVRLSHVSVQNKSAETILVVSWVCEMIISLHGVIDLSCLV